MASCHSARNAAVTVLWFASGGVDALVCAVCKAVVQVTVLVRDLDENETGVALEEHMVRTHRDLA